jgi:ABC-type nitrate/sulfonate/bicarbonate transport system permease component
VLVQDSALSFLIGGWLGSLIALMMEAARTSETSVDIQLRTRQYIPEDSEL